MRNFKGDRPKLPRLHPKLWLVAALAITGCSSSAVGPDPAIELIEACVKAHGDYEPMVAIELRALCDPSAIRGRTPEQQRVDAARVKELSR